jgi:hypothetical protein
MEAALLAAMGTSRTRQMGLDSDARRSEYLTVLATIRLLVSRPARQTSFTSISAMFRKGCGT